MDDPEASDSDGVADGDAVRVPESVVGPPVEDDPLEGEPLEDDSLEDDPLGEAVPLGEDVELPVAEGVAEPLEQTALWGRSLMPSVPQMSLANFMVFFWSSSLHPLATQQVIPSKKESAVQMHLISKPHFLGIESVAHFLAHGGRFPKSCADATAAKLAKATRVLESFMV